MPQLSERQGEIARRLLWKELGPIEEPGIAIVLRDTLEGALAPLVSRPPVGERIWANKRDLERALGCEGGYAADKQTPFTWTLPAARGRLIHRAIERFVLAKDPPAPLDLVGASHEHLMQQEDASGLGVFLQNMNPEETHDLIRDSVDTLVKFASDWPRIDHQYSPRTEKPLKATFVDRQVVLSARVDLALGFPHNGRRGTRLIELKTGFPSPYHMAELGFYALLETLARGVAPLCVALYYPDSGDLEVKDVTTEMLQQETGRVIEGLKRIHRATTLPFEDLKLTRNRACSWCPVRTSCEVGRGYRAA